jgi:hypothetical protein
VSRFRLDEYLQLFDFPSPMISAEKRYASNVPLQRLFFMNSDFVQQQAELLARKVAEEPDTTARIQKAYKLLYGRTATNEELKAGLEYLRTEPMKEYEERKAREKEKKAHPDAQAEDPAAPEEPKETAVATEAGGATPPVMGAGMMAGMGSGKGSADVAKPPKPMLPVTVWGRYAKILLSSPEFTFIN